jgi:hypothetical protein
MAKAKHLPKILGSLYAIGAVALALWTVGLAINLPTRHVVRHWDLAWVGFDVLIGFTMLLTATFAVKKSRYIILSSSGLGALLVTDAWFDILMSRPGVESHKAIFYAVVIELPIAIFSFFIAHYALKTFFVAKQQD